MPATSFRQHETGDLSSGSSSNPSSARPATRLPRFVVLISGKGSNMQAIAKDCMSGHCPATIAAVIANKPDAEGLNWAASASIATSVVPHRSYPNREAFDHALAAEIDSHQPDYVLLAGFMRVLTPGFVQKYAGRLINIHPSLLPAFPGLHTHAQAIATGVQAHGCTVHFVTPVLDHGPIIAQGVVPVLADDTPDRLSSRVLKAEHMVYPKVARWLAEGRVALLPDQRVEVRGVSSRLFSVGID